MAASGKETVLADHAANPAVASLLAWKREAVIDALWDRSELTVTIAPGDIRQAAKIVQTAGYNFLEDVTAVDWYPSEPRFQISYHILSHQYKERIRLKTWVDSSDPAIESITPVWSGANYYEREVFDLFGIQFTGHPRLTRIMMPDNWEGHPLRKDYPVEGYR